METSVEKPPEVKVDYIHCSPLEETPMTKIVILSKKIIKLIKHEYLLLNPS